MKSALVEIAQRFGVVIQLLLIEGDSLIEHRRGDAFLQRSVDRGKRGSDGRTDGGDNWMKRNQISSPWPQP